MINSPPSFARCSGDLLKMSKDLADDQIERPQVEQSVPGGGSGVADDSDEEAAVPVVRAVGRFGRECEPYILPLFPLESEQMMGRDGEPPINQSSSQTSSQTGL